MTAATPPQTMAFDGPCPFLTCLAQGPHTHPICPECGSVRYGNMFCPECWRQMESGGVGRAEMDQYLRQVDEPR